MKVYDLIDHLKKCPPEFLQNPVRQGRSKLATQALIADIFRKTLGNYITLEGEIPTNRDLIGFSKNKEHLRAIHLACWLISYKGFEGKNISLRQLKQYFYKELATVSEYVKANKWLEEEDRVEEFVRLALQSTSIIPDGETAAEAADRFDALSTIKRHGVLVKSKSAYDKMMKIRKQMAEKKAREAANPYSRE